jgi:hypothetical protein
MLRKIKTTVKKKLSWVLITLGIFSFIPSVRSHAEDRGLTIIDIKVIEAQVELAKLWVGQFKPYFDSHIGNINSDFLNNSYLRDQYVLLSLAFLALSLVIEVIMVMVQKSNIATLLPRFVGSLISSTTYLLIITLTISLAKAMMAGMMGTNGSFIEFTKSSLDVLKLNQDTGATVINSLISLLPLGNEALTIKGQTKLVINILIGLYSTIPFIVGISQFIADLIINVCWIISPLVAITHIHGVKLPFIKNFWGIFFDAIISKVAFTFSYTFIVSMINDRIKNATGTLDIGLACYIIGCFIGMGAITYTIREIFNLSSNYVVREQVKSGASAPVTVVQKSTSYVSSGIQTIQSLRR